MKEIKFLDEPFLRTFNKAKCRTNTKCYGCGKLIPKGTIRFVIFLHPDRASACDDCIIVKEVDDNE